MQIEFYRGLADSDLPSNFFVAETVTGESSDSPLARSQIGLLHASLLSSTHTVRYRKLK
jgi:hypothetical protein